MINTIFRNKAGAGTLIEIVEITALDFRVQYLDDMALFSITREDLQKYWVEEKNVVDTSEGIE